MAKTPAPTVFSAKCPKCSKELSGSTETNLKRTMGSHMARIHGVRGKFFKAAQKSQKQEKRSYTKRSKVAVTASTMDMSAVARENMVQSVIIKHQAALINELAKINMS